MTVAKLRHIELPYLLLSFLYVDYKWRPHSASVKRMGKKAFLWLFVSTSAKRSLVELQRSSVRTCCPCYLFDIFSVEIVFICLFLKFVLIFVLNVNDKPV